MKEAKTVLARRFGLRGIGKKEECLAPSGRKSLRSQDGEFIDAPAIQSILREFERCAVLVAVLLSITQRVAPERVVPFSLHDYQLSDPTIFSSLKYLLPEMGVPEDFDSGLHDFFAKFSEVMPIMREITADMPHGFDSAWVMHANRLLGAAAASALVLSEVITRYSHTPLENGPEKWPTQHFEQLMEEVTSGGTPCWINGKPSLPFWHLARCTRRFRLNDSATCMIDDNEYEVFAIDVSQLMLAISDVPGCKVGNKICVTLSTGRRLSGKVVQIRPGAIIVAFTEPLPLSDPLVGY